MQMSHFIDQTKLLFWRKLADFLLTLLRLVQNRFYVLNLID